MTAMTVPQISVTPVLDVLTKTFRVPAKTETPVQKPTPAQTEIAFKVFPEIVKMGSHVQLTLAPTAFVTT